MIMKLTPNFLCPTNQSLEKKKPKVISAVDTFHKKPHITDLAFAGMLSKKK